MPMPSLHQLIDDIEDLGVAIDEGPRPNGRKLVTARVQSRKTNQVKAIVKEKASADSIIPGTQSIYLKTWGCTHNSSDSEYMAGLLAAYGYTITDDKMSADMWLLNSCTVKNPAEDHFRNEIKAGQTAEKRLVVAGCVSQAAPKSEYLKGISIIGVQQIDRVVEVVEETFKGNTVRLLGQRKCEGKKMGGANLLLPKIRKNPLIEIIPISTGCLNQCTYCKTKHARGDLGSYPPEDIVERAVEAFKEGVVELWLTSEDTGAYGHDIGSSLPELIWQILAVIPNHCMLRIGMTNPPYILEHLEEMAKIFEHPRVYAFMHVPVQAGSDAVLADMKREYCIEDFCQVIDFIQNKVPGITIATDLICGFPTEKDEDFDESLDLVRKYKFPTLFINQFYPRPGTVAARMLRLPTKVVKHRSKLVSDLFASYQPYRNNIGKVYEILVTEVSHDTRYYVGHNKFYEQVLIEKSGNYMGKVVTVQIESTGKHHMTGRVIGTNETTRPTAGVKGQITGIQVALGKSLIHQRAKQVLKAGLSPDFLNFLKVVFGSVLVALIYHGFRDYL